MADSMVDLAIEQIDYKLTPEELATYLLLHAKWNDKNAPNESNLINISWHKDDDLMKTSFATSVSVDTMITLYGVPTMEFIQGETVMYVWKELFSVNGNPTPKSMFLTEFDYCNMIMVA